MLPEDVEGITSSMLASGGWRQRRRVEFGKSDGESDSDSEEGESDNDKGEGKGEGLARTKQKSRIHRGKRSTKRGN